MVVVHPLLHGHTLTMNQFLGNKRSRDLRLRCNCEACMDSLAGQTAILKVDVSCLREMPLQFNSCMPGSIKNVSSKGPLQHYKIPRCKTNIDIFVKPFQSLQTSMASLNHQYASIRLYFMEHADNARKLLD